MSYYDVLGVAPDAPAAVIRRSYLRLARQYHPDYHTTDDPRVRAANERAMQAVNEAWAVLSDPAARRRYDDRIDYVDAADHDAARHAARDATDRERRAWRPFDDGDDDIDPRLLADDPARVVISRRRQLLAVAPTVSFGMGVLLVAFGLVIQLLPVAALGLLAIIVSVLLFVIVPLLELSESARRDRR